MLRRRLCLYIKTYSVYNKCYFGQRRYCRRRPWLVFQFLSLTCCFIGYRRCCKKSIGKMWFGVLHTFHLKRAVYSRRINRGLPAFAAEFYAPELFKFPVVQQRRDQHHKAGTCIVTTPCATLGGGGSMTWGWKKPVRHFRPFLWNNEASLNSSLDIVAKSCWHPTKCGCWMTTMLCFLSVANAP